MKIIKHSIILIMAIVSGLTCICQATPPNAPTNPKTENSTNPTGVMDATPDFTWVFDDPDAGDSQSAYRVLVASTLDNLNNNIGDMWDSDKVKGTTCDSVWYFGEPLSRNTLYYWKIKTWDSAGEEGNYCAYQTFQMGSYNRMAPNLVTADTDVSISMSDTSGIMDPHRGDVQCVQSWGTGPSYPDPYVYSNPWNTRSSKLCRDVFFGKDADGSNYTWEVAETAPYIRMISNAPAVAFYVPSQMVAKAGEPTRVKVVVIDDVPNVVVNYTGTVLFDSTDASAVLPASYTFTTMDKGVHFFEDVVFNTLGIQKITVSDGSISGESNYIKVQSETPEYYIYMGDIHTHSLYSDATITVDDHYTYCRNMWEFGAMSDHDKQYWVGAGAFRERVVPFAQKYNTPPYFVTFCIYEWSRASGFGHLNPMFLYEDDYQQFSQEDYPDPLQLWDVLAMNNLFDVITPPHHLGKPVSTNLGYDLDYFNDHYFKCAEMYSWHGEAERYNLSTLRPYGEQEAGGFVQDAWERGYKFGIFGAGDNHQFHMGHLYNDATALCWARGGRTDFYGTGIAGVYASQQDRQEIYDAFKNRRTYATTGERIFLEFEIDGHMMGSDYYVPNTATKPLLDVLVGGTTELYTVEVVKYSKSDGWNQALYTEYPVGMTCQFQYSDTSFIEDCLYYIRVTQENDYEQAWASPIWVTVLPEAPRVSPENWSNFASQRIDLSWVGETEWNTDITPDCRIEVQDLDSGLCVGSMEQPKTPEMKGLWNFTEGSGSSTADSSDRWHPGTVSDPTNMWTPSGRTGNALLFDGIDDRVECGDVMEGFGILTVQAWVNVTDNSGERSVVCEGGTTRGHWLLTNNGSNQLEFGIRGTSSLTDQVTYDSSVLTPGQWHHLAGVWYGGKYLKLYVDGKEVASKATARTTVPTPGTQLRIGGSSETHPILSGGGYFSGMIDDVSVFNRALSPEEIACSYHSGQYRYSTNGGSSWSDWIEATCTGSNGTVDLQTLTATAVDFNQNSPDQNKIQFMISDMAGNFGISPEYTVKTSEALDPEKVLCTAEPVVIQTDGITTSLITASITDMNDIMVPTATNDITFGISGDGTLLGTTQKAASSGTATVVLRAGITVGTVTVTATSSGLTGGSVGVDVAAGTASKLVNTAVSSVLSADGSSTLLITAQATDQYNNPVTTVSGGQSIGWSGLSSGTGVWFYRKELTIDSSSVETGYQVKVAFADVGMAGLVGAGKVQADYRDVRFSDSADPENNPSDEKEYWIDTYGSNVYVRMDLAGGDNYLYMYYGNTQATDASDGDSTFEFFDDFEDASLDTGKWDTANFSGTVDETGGELRLTSATAADDLIFGKTSFGINTEAVFYAACLDMSGVDQENENDIGYRTNNDWIDDVKINEPFGAVSTWKKESRSGGTYSNTPMAQTLDAGYHTFRIARNSSSLASYQIDANTPETESDNIPTTAIPVYLRCHAGTGRTSRLYCDWVFVRQLAVTDPTVSAGSEEENVDDARIIFSVSGEGTLISSTSPYAVNGLATVILQSTTSPGTATVTSTADNLDEDTVEVEMLISFNPVKMICSADPASIEADGLETSLITAGVHEADNTPVPTATNTITFSIAGEGTLLNTTVKPAAGGTATVAMQSTTTAGTATVTATSDNLAQDSFTVTTSSEAKVVAAPENLILTPARHEVTVSWTAGTDNQGYRVDKKIDGGQYAVIADSITITSIEDSGLNAGATYWYRIRSYDSEYDYSDWVEDSCVMEGVQVIDKDTSSLPVGLQDELIVADIAANTFNEDCYIEVKASTVTIAHDIVRGVANTAREVNAITIDGSIIGGNFNNTVKLRLYYDEDELEEGMDENDLRIYILNESRGEWDSRYKI